MNKITEMIMKYENEIKLIVKNSFNIDKHKFITGDKLNIVKILEQDKILIEVFDCSNYLTGTIILSFKDLEKIPFKLVNIIREIESLKITLEQFNYRQFRTSAIKWFNNKGVIKINDNINAIILPILYSNKPIELDNASEAYIGYNVKIISKIIGELDNQNFIFDNYLTTMINGLNIIYENKFMFANDYNKGYTWYLLEIDKKEFNYYEQEIMKYINMWK